MAKEFTDEELQKIKYMSGDVIRRFIPDFRKFYYDYTNNRKGSGTRDRFLSLNKEVTKEDKKLLEIFFSEEYTIKDIADKYKITKSNVDSKVRSICKKIVFQNKEKLF